MVSLAQNSRHSINIMNPLTTFSWIKAQFYPYKDSNYEKRMVSWLSYMFIMEILIPWKSWSLYWNDAQHLWKGLEHRSSSGTNIQLHIVYSKQSKLLSTNKKSLLTRGRQGSQALTYHNLCYLWMGIQNSSALTEPTGTETLRKLKTNVSWHLHNLLF